MTYEVDTHELVTDFEKLYSGELSLPTVSAVMVLIDGVDELEVPVYLEGRNCA